MKILMFGWEFPPHISGGLGTACHGISRALASHSDVEVIFVVPKLWGDEEKINVTLLGADEVPVIRQQIQFPDAESKLEYYELKSGLIPYLGSSEFSELKTKISSDEIRLVETTSEGKIIFGGGYDQNLFQEIRSFAIVAEKLAVELEFDVIHVHDWMTFPAGISVSRISGKPLVVHVHSTEFDRSGNQVNPEIYEIEKMGMDFAHKIIAVSNLTRKLIIRNYYIEPKKVFTVYNAVEPFEKYSVPETKSTDEEKIVLFLGRITYQKGPEYFVEAARLVLEKFENVRFVMAGKGDLRDKMIQRVDELNMSAQFEFPGFIPDNEVAKLLSSCDVFVMPSVSEPFGIVALEAMQAGVSAIVSKQLGASEILKNVICVDYWNVGKMAKVVLQLLQNEAMRIELGKKGKKEVEKLVWEKSAVKIIRIYKAII